MDLDTLGQYIEHIRNCGASASEIVLHHGDACDFTRRVHILRHDWETVIYAYRDAGLALTIHGPLTPDFALARIAEDEADLLRLYGPILDAVSEVAADQGGTIFVLHGAAHPDFDIAMNENLTRRSLARFVDHFARSNGDVQLAIELRAAKPTRPTAAATSRASVMRIVEGLEVESAGICWDVAHDMENTLAACDDWTVPGPEFLARVNHLHAHDIADDGEPHCPLVYEQVPVIEAMELLPDVSMTLEIRWHMAERIGEPWQMLAESYLRVLSGAQAAQSTGTA
jgi:sugar phosphate isomerase/epimerase